MSMLRVCSASPSWKTARKSTTTSTDTIAKSATAAPRSSRGSRIGPGQPFTDDSALWNMSTSWSLATTHSAVTRPAVIRVMRTQPGTSPRSARRRPRSSEAAGDELRIARGERCG